MKNGAFAFLQKPLKADDFFYRIKLAILSSAQILSAAQPAAG